MKWFHQVDPIWLAARKQYLTASDVKKLIPVTATGRARTNVEESYLKAWADKQCLISEDDICSSGVMARGHLLEPYALAEFNKLGAIPATLKLWDDMLIYSKDGVSCSPDALDLEQPVTTEVGLKEVEAYYLGEIKCYNPGVHYQVGLSKAKMQLEERWQIATAFYIMPTLKLGALILFNPSARHPLFYHLFTRHDLKDELEMIEQVSKDYQVITAGFSVAAGLACPDTVKEACVSEAEIITELMEQQAINQGLNP